MEKSTFGDEEENRTIVRWSGRVGLARARAEFRFVWEEVTGSPEQRAAAAGILPRLHLSDGGSLTDSL